MVGYSCILVGSLSGAIAGCDIFLFNVTVSNATTQKHTHTGENTIALIVKRDQTLKLARRIFWGLILHFLSSDDFDPPVSPTSDPQNDLSDLEQGTDGLVSV